MFHMGTLISKIQFYMQKKKKNVDQTEQFPNIQVHVRMSLVAQLSVM